MFTVCTTCMCVYSHTLQKQGRMAYKIIRCKVSEYGWNRNQDCRLIVALHHVQPAIQGSAMEACLICLGAFA